MKHYKQALDIISDNDLDWRGTCVEMAKANPAAFVKAAIRCGWKDEDPWKKEARRLYLEEGEKVAAIKYCRAETGMGLKESKEAVEALT